MHQVRQTAGITTNNVAKSLWRTDRPGYSRALRNSEPRQTGFQADLAITCNRLVDGVVVWRQPIHIEQTAPVPLQDAVIYRAEKILKVSCDHDTFVAASNFVESCACEINIRPQPRTVSENTSIQSVCLQRPLV